MPKIKHYISEENVISYQDWISLLDRQKVHNEVPCEISDLNEQFERIIEQLPHPDSVVGLTSNLAGYTEKYRSIHVGAWRVVYGFTESDGYQAAACTEGLFQAMDSLGALELIVLDEKSAAVSSQVHHVGCDLLYFVAINSNMLSYSYDYLYWI